MSVNQLNIRFDNSYAKLPHQFYTRMLPTPVAKPGLIRLNEDLCRSLNIDTDWLRSEEGVGFIAGNFIPEGADPIATVYAGHQFGSWNPQLGDGRAILMGEVFDDQGRRFDIQLKGSGPTPYSRGGDGRAPLGPILREYIVSEAMHALGVPTSRSLAAVTTGENVFREAPQPGGVIARVAQSHIRIGTFEFFAAKRDIDGLKTLADHVIQRHYPQVHDDLPQGVNAMQCLFRLVMAKEADLVAHWQSLGFIHGVMNTDNILLSGETIDYGPCAFIDGYQHDSVFSSIDVGGRYAYRNQPSIMQWNLSALVRTFLPLMDENQDQAIASAQAMIDDFPALFKTAYLNQMSKKIGLADVQPGDDTLISDLLDIMHGQASDFVLTFRHLATLVDPENRVLSGLSHDFQLAEVYAPWLIRWQERLKRDKRSSTQRRQSMNLANPIFIPRNHLVEEAIVRATGDGDFKPFNDLVDLLSKPYVYQHQFARFSLPPRPEQIIQNTFCGT